MITNSSTNKLKASKSSRDLEDIREVEGVNKPSLSDRGEGDKDKLASISGDSINIRAPLPTIVICQRERPDSRLKSRPRVRDEFRMARGGPMDRRSSNVRSRGGGVSRKVERENDSGILSRGKFQESLNKGNSDSAISSSKYYSDADRNKNRLEFGYMVPEDSRISKLLRRLCREDDSEKFLVLCRQLQESLMVPENGRYIRRSLDLIAESLLDTLHSGPGSEAKYQASKCLGKVGYVLEQDFKKYMDWIFSKYAVERNDEVRLLLMKAMAETLRLEGEIPKLKDFSVVLMTQLQTALENTDLPDLLRGTVDVIILLTEIYPSTFTKHFRDTVDILVGWHIDSSQAITVTQYASSSLQKLTRYWVADLQFSLTLLGQFLEDMEAYGEDLVFPTSGRSSPAEDPPPSPEDCILRITSLIRVFNTVTKSLGQHLNPTVSPQVTWSFLTECFSKMLRTVVKALETSTDEDLIVTANECACLLLTHLQSKTSPANEMLYGLINTQLSLVPRLADFTIISMLRMIAKTIRDVSANLPLDLVQTLLGSDSAMLELRFSPSQNVRAEVLAVYHSLLNLKNIPLLQEAYRCVLSDLEAAYKMYVPSVDILCQQNPQSDVKYNLKDAETVIIFNLHSLADLANASNSIIAMWALKPSILELLASRLLPYDSNLAQSCPALQYCVLYLLYSHCSRYNNFVSSSGLVASTLGRSNVHDILGLPATVGLEVPTTSPTSGHLSVILGLLTKMLSQETCEETRLLVLAWTRELIIQAQPYLSVLHRTPEFEKLLYAVTDAGFHHSSSIVLGVAGNVEQLLAAKEVPWKDKLLSEILDLCILHLNSTNNRVRVKFSHLFSMVPWHITVCKLSKANQAVEVKVNMQIVLNKPLHELSGFTLEILQAAERHHLARSTCGEIQPQHFRKFMGYLLQSIQHSDNDWLQDMFSSCWPLQQSLRPTDEDRAISVFGTLALASNLVLLLWAAWEAAQFCVMYKLRTPLGKPQDTFTNIEGAIKNLAREISQPHSSSEDSSASRSKESSTPTNGSAKPITSVCSSTWEQRRVRLLLEFLEHLEKAMHNAAEGCATAMLPPPKPVRTFFHTNKSTCGEWLTRIRTAVVVVAIHAGQATTAVRHGHCLLQDMADTNSTQGPEFERAVMYVSWALCRLREPESILGLYAWCKDVSGRKLSWLKAAAEQAQGRYEAASENYRKLLNQECLGSTHNSPTHLTAEESTSSSPVKQTGKPEADQHIVGFMADQLSECYKAVSNWSDLLKWKEKETELWTSQNGGTPYKYLMSSISNPRHAKALAKFEEGELSAVSELMKWSTPGTSLIEQIWDTSKNNNNKCWSSYKLMGKAYSTLTSIAMTLMSDGGQSDLETDNIVWGEKIQNCSHIAQCHLQEGLRNTPSEFVHEAAVLQYAALGLHSLLGDKINHNIFSVMDSVFEVDLLNSSLLTQVLWWGKFFNQSIGGAFGGDVHVHSSWLNQLTLDVSRVARKEGNLVLAQKLLLDYLKSENGLLTLDSGAHKKNKLVLEDVTQSLIDSAVKGKEPNLPISMIWNVENARAVTEVSKVLYSLEKHDSAVQMCAMASLNLAQQLGDQNVQLRERESRLLLTLAKWLQQENHLISGELDDDKSAVGRLLSWEKTTNIANDPSVFGTVDFQSCNAITHNGTQVIPPADAVIGRLLQLGVSRCPELAKAWSQFASWCYRWGRRVVDAASEAGGQLSEVDRVAVQQLMPPEMTADDLDKVYFILSQTRAVADEEDIEADDFNTSEMIESQLQNVHALSEANSDQLTQLVEIWRDAQKRIYSYYELSALSYFKYLQLCGDREIVGAENSCTTITATLRLLRLIVKHALELQSVLESGLASTPTQPWKGIIPQLFSRLSHPEPYVRRRVSELLCRVAEDAPHLITFPAVVGAAAGGARLRDMTMGTTTSRLFSTCLSQSLAEEDMGDVEDEEEEEEEDEEECASEEENQVSVLKNCFLAMVDTLSKQAPEAISQVQLLVQELRRITLLWDELWLGTLVQHHAEISRRMQQLELEVLRVEDNTSLTGTEKDKLIAEKHRIILKPLVFILEQLHAITSVPPETPHEKWFQEKFGEYISDALQKLKTSWNPRRPQESWQPLKQLQSRLQQRAQKRAAYTIHMSDVSPALAGLKNSLIAMPGVASSSGTIITVAAVDNNIAILPTKTKPKKLIFHGSDGQQYTYLFKGLEDLHLDERIMQFLSIANTMMRRSTLSSESVYRARHYSVIPLGPRSGLISWVDGVTPLFGLYKRWQQRETATVSLRGGQSSTNLQPGSGPGQVMRPSELFYSKLTPLLKERGIANLDNRKEWPLPILRQVLTELREETPKDLLAKELWCHSVNAGSWWQTTRRYSYSVAVMSIIGYIIGLGDRHLDNVLVDLTTGEVVHIDYNVCFEKGKTLRVPEKVPFRMTPNIRTALGVTGVEGIFRLACEHVLKVMKKGRETLLTLLEAFVYDPLIDWTPGNEAGYTGAVYGGGQAITMETKQSRKELEREVTLGMFCVRVAEMKADWLANRDELLAAILELVTRLNQWLEVQGRMKVAEESLQDCHQQMALVKEAEAHGPSAQHPLYTLATRYAKHRRARDALDKVRATLKEKIEDCEKHLNLHKVALASVRGPQLSQWVAELNFPMDKDSHMVFDLVKEFLQNAGQGQMILQCEQSESELGQLAQQQMVLVRSCLDLLSQYGTVASLYPASYLNSHRSVCYRLWSQQLLNNLAMESCHEVRAQFQALFSPETLSNKPLSQQVLSFSYQLQASLAEANARLKKSYERLAAEGLPEAGVRLDAAYNDARAGINAFLRGEQGASIALECVNITALCALNKRYLMMEAAALSAGDCLVDLTSREGDWFLDEMYLVSTLVTELASLLPSHHHLDSTTGADTRVELVLQCLKSAHSIYKGLQELNFNFHTIILPEALKTIQTEEPTVLAMVNELDDIIAGVGCPLEDLLVQLERHLRYIIMEMDSPHHSAQNVVSEIRTRFDLLLLRPAELTAEAVDGHGTGVNSCSGVSTSDDVLTPGQMLLMGFNGLFEKLQLEGNALIAALETLDTPHCWKKVDQVWEAKAMAAPVFNDATRSVLEDIFLLKRLATMQQFFSLCGQVARGATSVFDDDHLNKPIRRFTADYVSGQLLGVTSQTLALALCLLLQRIGLNVTVEVEQRDIGAENKVSLEELCRKAVDLCIKSNQFSGGTLAQASGLTSTLEATWRRREVARHLQQHVEAQRSTLQRLQLQLTAHNWLHEDILMLQGAPLTAMAPINCPTFMLELRKTSSALLALQPRLTEAREQQSVLVSSVEQRLKWAADQCRKILLCVTIRCVASTSNDRPTFMLELRKTSSALLALQPRLTEAREQQSSLVSSVEQRLKWAAGANPALSEVMAAFESAVSARSEGLNLEQRLSTLVGNTCNALLHHEALRTRTSEGLAHDAAFLQLMDQCEKSCALAAGCEQAVTPAEESLVQLLAPDGPIDHTWIHNAELLISDTVKSLQQQMVGLQESLFTAQDSLKSQVIVVRNRLSTHHKLMSDVRNLLKSMVKLEDCGLVGLQDYVQSYRTYSEQFSGLIRELMSEELDGDRIHKALHQLEHLKEKTGAIYEELLVFAKQEDEQEKNSPPFSHLLVSEEASGIGRAKRPPLLRQESVCLSPRKGVPVIATPLVPSAAASKPGRDPHTGKAVQERNAYALGVWRRVRMKLEGRDPDPGRRATIQEQVDYVIREAMSLDNLALLYEGWTPWV